MLKDLNLLGPLVHLKKLYNNSIIPPKICRNRQGQADRDHEVWTPKDVAQGQGFDCQAKVNFEIIYTFLFLNSLKFIYSAKATKI